MGMLRNLIGWAVLEPILREASVNKVATRTPWSGETYPVKFMRGFEEELLKRQIWSLLRQFSLKKSYA